MLEQRGRKESFFSTSLVGVCKLFFYIFILLVRSFISLTHIAIVSFFFEKLKINEKQLAILRDLKGPCTLCSTFSIFSVFGLGFLH